MPAMNTRKLRIPRLTLQRWRVLDLLRQPGERSIADLAAATKTTRANAHHHLVKAAHDGLAATDSTACGWRLTARGAALLAALDALPE